MTPFNRARFAAPLPPGLVTMESVMKEGEGTVTMIVPTPVNITLEKGVKVHIPEGTQEVPESLANHFYLKACGATVYGGKKAKEPDAPASNADTGSDAGSDANTDTGSDNAGDEASQGSAPATNRRRR